MRQRSFAPIALCASSIFLGSGCGGDGSGQKPNRPVLPIDAPVLFSIEPEQEELSVGQEITLVGVNFSSVLAEDRVVFRFGNARIPGLPLRIEFPTDKNPRNGLESRLQVVVPTGVTAGNVELEVGGVFAGSAGYVTGPQIVSFGIGDSGQEPRLIHGGPFGFDDQFPPHKVILFGLGFDGVDRILVSDSQGGNQVSVPQNQITLRPLFNPPANNLQQIGFSLKGLRLAVQGQRDNITVQVATPRHLSNKVQVPVANFDIATTRPGIGAVINGVLVPPGVRTGPVRIRCSLYDFPTIDQAHEIEVDWSADGGGSWHPAAPVVNVYNSANPGLSKVIDPEEDGFPQVARQVLPGAVEFGSPAGILYAGGSLRTFTWDAQNDPDFRALLQDVDPRVAGRRDRVLYFRIHPRPEIDVEDKPLDSGHFIISPPVAYHDAEDRGKQDGSAGRSGELLEGFKTDANADRALTTAHWGPPFNKDKLRGGQPDSSNLPAGRGNFDLVLAREAPPPVGLVDEYFEVFSTETILRIDHFQVFLDPDQDPSLATVGETVFPTVDHPNPGEDAGEFHLRTLRVEEGLDVRLSGTRPVVFRISGDPRLPVAARIDGTLHANGEPGSSPWPSFVGSAPIRGLPPSPFPGRPGAGGKGRCGGGDGGNGAAWDGWPGFRGEVTGLVRAGEGGNDGGRGGETAGAIDPIISTSSKFLGAPGGGGGNFMEGGTGDVGPARSPGNFTASRGGRGGPKRGSSRLVSPSAGSGGGGGGGTILRDPDPTPADPALPCHGAGGGGGGGAIQITVEGDIVIGGKIQANGGRGGHAGGLMTDTGVRPAPQVSGPPSFDLTRAPDSGAGGGGSGGCILLQASGSIDAGADHLEVLGGPAGSMGSLQRSLSFGEGDGAPGWIRIETRRGGGPRSSSSLACESTLSAPLDSSVKSSLTVNVADGSCFPASGVVLIESERILYRERSGSALGHLTRGWGGTSIAPHASGAAVKAELTVDPAGGLVVDRGGKEYFEDPDAIAAGKGVDGLLHVRFIPSEDPATGLHLLDPDSGDPVSLWRFDTDTGMVQDPLGIIALVAAREGVLELTRLRIDPSCTLRVSGTRPLRIQVTEVADIAGTLDLSGEGGGALEFDVTRPEAPGPGPGGRAGPGGGDGGAGGSMVFIDQDLENKLPENTIPIPAQPGGLPPGFPGGFDRTGATGGAVPPPGDLAGLETTRPTPGDPLRDPGSCGGSLAVPCTAGGGGGGGARSAGASGRARPESSTAFGRGGSAFGLDGFRFGGILFLLGGQGGAGGGASAVVSQRYRDGADRDPRIAVFQGAARFGPGTGGGGGGGVLHLAVGGSLVLRSTGKVLARGGDSLQSIELAGNGGAGAGGSVLIQAANSFTVEPGARIDVRGGRADLPPPFHAGAQLPLYEGNIQKGGSVDRVLGGRGGDGACGRVRIEVPRGSSLLGPAANESVSSSLLLDAFPTAGVSRPIPLGVGPGSMALSHLLIPGGPGLRFADLGIPEGTDAYLLWEGAAPSLDVHGVPARFGGGVEDIGDLRDLEYVRFTVEILSRAASSESPTIEEVRLPVRLGDPAEDGS